MLDGYSFTCYAEVRATGIGSVRDNARVSNSLPHPITGRLFPSPVVPGTAWPGDVADAATPVAGSGDVADLAHDATLEEISARSSVCAACPRLVEWRVDVATSKRASFADQPYWGRPVPSFGDDEPNILIVGLAPAAHGANRTGRMFTGDRSGDWLYAALYRAGLASQPTAVAAGDGLRLNRARITASVRCAPPANKPTPSERDACAQWLRREMDLVLPYVRSIVALGSYGWESSLRTLMSLGMAVPRPKPKFAHGAEVTLGDDQAKITLIGSFHPSQQNTFTGKLTEPMLDEVFSRAVACADERP